MGLSKRTLRQDSIVVGDRKIVADVFERHNEGRLGNDHHGVWTLWFDPRTGIWIKSNVSVLSGLAEGVSQTGGALLSIVVP
jgi:hypothetical protein